MRLVDLGFNDELERFRMENNPGNFEVGRVVTEHRERYLIRTDKDEFEAEVTGNLRFTAKGREDFPAVGDWVFLTSYDSGFALIHRIFPRFSVVKRQAAGQSGEVQIIAANIDYAFVVQAIDRDFNINRIERYLIICNSSNVIPIIVLTKIDLIDERRLHEILAVLNERIKNTHILSVSNLSLDGITVLKSHIEKGKTYCMLGSSGVGKSTLINNLAGQPIMRTDALSISTNKGRHVTSHRELVIIEDGGILIDNPGMREVGISDSGGGLEITFDVIANLSRHCKFIDCTHTTEIGCSVLAAVKEGTINEASYENYLKMQKEKAHYEATVAERQKKDKDFGKIMKNYKKEMKRNKY
jgi:ribosome biogenesis GTPase / thiamine phosphate phosphatase